MKQQTHRIIQSNQLTSLTMATVLSMGMCGISQAADDHKLYPGSYCQTTSQGYAYDDAIHGSGSISNTSFDHRMIVRCPIIRDYSAGNASLKRVRVWFHNNNTEKTMSCYVSTRNADGTYKRLNKSGRSTLGARQGSFTVEYGGDSGTNTFYTLTCYLPKTVEAFRFPRIKAFKVEEVK